MTTVLLTPIFTKRVDPQIGSGVLVAQAPAAQCGANGVGEHGEHDVEVDVEGYGAGGDYAPAFKADKTASRVPGRFGVGIPTLAKSVRKVLLSAV